MARTNYSVNETTGPAVVSYQGEVMVDGEPFSGTGHFKFAFVNAAGTFNYWTNNGTNLGAGGTEPTDAVPLDVVDGLFSVLLGNTTLTNMNVTVSADVFADKGRQLHIWFDPDGVGPYTDLGLTAIAAVPYAFNAETLDGQDGSYYDQHYAHVVVVAKNGRDYTSVQAAIDSISDASAAEPYLVWVGPGTYSETVVMKPYVHLQGAGQEVTIIYSTIGEDGDPGFEPTKATLVLSGYVSLRDLTVKNEGGNDKNAAILATGDVTQTLISDVSAHTFGNGEINSGIYLCGDDFPKNYDLQVTLLDVTALAENGTNANTGLHVFKPDRVYLRGGSYTGRGDGSSSTGVIASSSGDFLAENILAMGEGSATGQRGLYTVGGSNVRLIGGEYIGRGGTLAYGILVDSGGGIDANGILARGLEGTYNYGIYGYKSGGHVNIYDSVLEGVTQAAYCLIDNPNKCIIAQTHLIGGKPNDSTYLTCVGVSRGITFTAGLDCP